MVEPGTEVEVVYLSRVFLDRCFWCGGISLSKAGDNFKR